MPDHFTEPGRAWARGAVAVAAPVDARPRPRLTWEVSSPECARLRFGEMEVGRAHDGEFHDYVGADPWVRKPAASLRDAAINLRLRFMERGFDVDDVPDEILGGGK